MQAFLKFHRGLLKLPVPWQLWLMILVAVNLVFPLFFLSTIEARVALGVFMASFVLMIGLTALAGFSRLLGLGHFLWFPLLVFLWSRLPLHPIDDPFGWWLRGLMVFNALSLVIDVVDVVRYTRGERQEVIAGL